MSDFDDGIESYEDENGNTPITTTFYNLSLIPVEIILFMPPHNYSTTITLEGGALYSTQGREAYSFAVDRNRLKDIRRDIIR